jgi:tetracycline resistance efflux pump
VGSVVLLKLQGTRIFIALFEGSLLTVFLTIAYLLVRGCIALRDVSLIIKQGLLLMASSVMVVLLIWTLSELLKQDLHTGQYLAGLIGAHVSVALLPVLFFLVASLISATMGSAWGTIGTLMPIVVPMIESLSDAVVLAGPGALALLLPSIGAVISGAVSGNHLAPVADVMFMSATSSACYHLDLVRVMVGFAIPVVIATACAFICAGFLIMAGYGTFATVLLSFAIGCAVNFLIVSVLHWWSHRGS